MTAFTWDSGIYLKGECHVCRFDSDLKQSRIGCNAGLETATQFEMT